MLRQGTRKRTASARAGVRRTPVTSQGVSSVQSALRDSKPGHLSESIYTTSGLESVAIPTVSTARRLMPTLPHNPDNTVHIPDMSPVPLSWQPRDPQPTCVITQNLCHKQFKAQHIDGLRNEIADSISRLQLHRFRELAPGAELVPENNPEEFRDLILSLKQTD
ncbi:unnamed protein product [Mytilus coruscus]|uniref:Uncharacterized protein n=1 Tax=Mytilus coruscus TaxID=42192 RepID=A0A6J8AQA3_MYTCO|nr:unnamed protein product [Mytilus coruscus]